MLSVYSFFKFCHDSKVAIFQNTELEHGAFTMNTTSIFYLLKTHMIARTVNTCEKNITFLLFE